MVAVLERPTLAQLERAFATAEHARQLVDLGFAHEVVDIAADGVVRFAHPLLASAVYADIPPAARAKLQSQAAEIADDEEERARHLALAASAPDMAVATALDDAVARAAARGAQEAAAELARQALRLTAPDDIERVRRGLVYATHLMPRTVRDRAGHPCQAGRRPSSTTCSSARSRVTIAPASSCSARYSTSRTRRV